MKYTNGLSHFNMFITKKNIFDNYCEWLFRLLFEVEKDVKISPYTYQARVFGFMSERLLQLYVVHNKLNVKYLPFYFITNDNTKKIDIIYQICWDIRNFIFFNTSIFIKKISHFFFHK
jgi:hypothetical protein